MFAWILVCFVSSFSLIFFTSAEVDNFYFQNAFVQTILLNVTCSVNEIYECGEA